MITPSDRDCQRLAAFELAVVFEMPHLQHCDRLLNPQQAQALLADIAATLQSVWPQISDFSLVMVGALFDLAQLQRPGFPILTTLQEIVKTQHKGHQFHPALIAIGTDQSCFPITVLNPEQRSTSSPMLILPLVLVGEKAKLDPLANQLENRLMQDVLIGATLKQHLADAFGIQPLELGLATIGDLNALTAAQLIQIGLEPLWQILQHALFELPDQLTVELSSGHQLSVYHNEVSIQPISKLEIDQSWQEVTHRLQRLFHLHGIALAQT